MQKSKAKKPSRQGNGRAATEQREAIFVEQFIANGGDETKAAIAAGYSAKTASQMAYKIMRRPTVAEAIRSRQDALAEKHELTSESVIAELSKIVHVDPRQFFNEDGSLKAPHEWSDRMAGAVASLEIDELFDGQGKERKQIGHTKKLKFWNKTDGIDKAMRHLGLFEKDNAQKANALAGLSADVIKAIRDRLKNLKDASPRLAG